MTTSERLPLITDRADVPDAGHHHYDAIEESRGGVVGPFRVLLHSPELAGRIGHLGAYIRFEGVLSPVLRETAILSTARAWRCAFEWVSHEPIAREAGVESAVIELIAEQGDTSVLDDPERTVVSYVWELLDETSVSERTYAQAVEQLGEVGVIELTATIGYYSMIAFVLNAFAVQPEDDQPPFG